MYTDVYSYILIHTHVSHQRFWQTHASRNVSSVIVKDSCSRLAVTNTDKNENWDLFQFNI